MVLFTQRREEWLRIPGVFASNYSENVELVGTEPCDHLIPHRCQYLWSGVASHSVAFFCILHHRFRPFSSYSVGGRSCSSSTQRTLFSMAKGLPIGVTAVVKPLGKGQSEVKAALKGTEPLHEVCTNSKSPGPQCSRTRPSGWRSTMCRSVLGLRWKSRCNRPARTPAGANRKSKPDNNYVDRHVFAKLQQLQILPSTLATGGGFLRRVSVQELGFFGKAVSKSAGTS